MEDCGVSVSVKSPQLLVSEESCSLEVFLIPMSLAAELFLLSSELRTLVTEPPKLRNAKNEALSIPLSPLTRWEDGRLSEPPERTLVGLPRSSCIPSS